jgi:hypothetical protein
LNFEFSDSKHYKKHVDVPAKFRVAILATRNRGQNHVLLVGR